MRTSFGWRQRIGRGKKRAIYYALACHNSLERAATSTKRRNVETTTLKHRQSRRLRRARLAGAKETTAHGEIASRCVVPALPTRATGRAGMDSSCFQISQASQQQLNRYSSLLLLVVVAAQLCSSSRSSVEDSLCLLHNTHGSQPGMAKRHGKAFASARYVAASTFTQDVAPTFS